jgi:hypothetical protein
MGLLKNLFVGGSRPKKDKETGLIRCGDCREVIQPDARRCPNCNAKVFTMRGRAARRGGIVLAILLFAGGGAGGIIGIILSLLGLLTLGGVVYYYVNRPVHALRPPHRPLRPEEQTHQPANQSD